MIPHWETSSRFIWHGMPAPSRMPVRRSIRCLRDHRAPKPLHDVCRRTIVRGSTTTAVLVLLVVAAVTSAGRHYLSDVVGGGIEGIIIGRAVTWHGRNNWNVIPVVTKETAAIVVARQ
jgi:membrane-associated phospholipid phosphatase